MSCIKYKKQLLLHIILETYLNPAVQNIRTLSFRSIGQTQLNSFVVNPNSQRAFIANNICLKFSSKAQLYFCRRVFKKNITDEEKKRNNKILKHKHTHILYVQRKVISWTYSYTFGKGLVCPDGPLSHSNRGQLQCINVFNPKF